MRLRSDALCLTILVALALPVGAQDSLPSSGPPPATAETGLRSTGFPIATIFTNLPGDGTAAVPGHPGVSFEPGTGTGHFDRVYGSPGGNWILTADTDRPAGTDEVVLVNGAVVAIEGDPASWTGGTEAIGPIATQVAINDAGSWAFTTNTTGPTTADDYLVVVTGGVFAIAAQEGGAIAAVPGASWGGVLESGAILADGTGGLVGDGITGAGVTTADDEIIVVGSTLLAREGVTVPAGQVGSEAWENFDVGDFRVSADGTHWLVQGDLTGVTTTDDVVAVDGAVVIQEGVALAGAGFAEPVDGDGIVGVQMDAGGGWFARGNNDTTEQDWVYGSDGLVAFRGGPVTLTSLETWSDTDFSDCFFLHVGSATGHFVIGGVTSASSTANGLLVLDNLHEVARESQPVDIDGNGLFDDDAFFDTFGNDDGHLTDDGTFYFVATIKDGTGTRIGQGFFAADLSTVVPVELQSFQVE